MDSFLKTLFLPEKIVPALLLEEIIALTRPVPTKFLTFIAADIKRIEELAKEDLEEFKIVSKRKDLRPQYATVRYMAAVYSSLALPSGLSEADAVIYLLDYCREKRFRCAITFRGFKSIFVEPDGDVSTIFYPPVLRMSEYSIIPDDSGYQEGRSYMT